MVKITNGINTVEVTSGAFETIYKAQGYKVVNSKAGKAVDGKVEKKSEPVADRFADLVEKPISQWTKNEVKEYADANGIDLAGTKNVNEAKDRIKAAIADEF